jgi:hypothetical protein
MIIETYTLIIADDKRTKSLHYGGNGQIVITSNLPEDSGDETTICIPRQVLVSFIKLIEG